MTQKTQWDDQPVPWDSLAGTGCGVGCLALSLLCVVLALHVTLYLGAVQLIVALGEPLPPSELIFGVAGLGLTGLLAGLFRWKPQIWAIPRVRSLWFTYGGISLIYSVIALLEMWVSR